MIARSISNRMLKTFASLSIVIGVACAGYVNAQDAQNTFVQADLANATLMVFHLGKFDVANKFFPTPDYARQVLLSYMNQLDPEHLFFSNEEQVEILSSNNEVLGAIQNKNLAFADDIAAKHASDVQKRIDYALTLVDKGFSFDGNDRFVMSVPWSLDFSSDTALKARWENIVKSDWLNLKLDGLTDAQIRDRLRSRYNHFSQALIQNEQTMARFRFVKACILAGDVIGDYNNATHFPEHYATFNGISLGDDADGPTVFADADDAGGLLRHSGDRLVAASANDGSITDFLGLTAQAAAKQLNALSDSGAVTLFVRPFNSPFGAPVLAIPAGDHTALAPRRVSIEFVRPTGASDDVRVAVITVPSMYGFTKRVTDGATSDVRADVDLRQALDQASAQHARAVVLDLRGNPGGYMDTVAQTTRMFLGDRPLWRLMNGTGVHLDQKDSDGPAPWNGPLTVLVNKETVSGGELFAGALQDYGRALIVGGKTQGNTNVATNVDLNRFVRPPRIMGSDLGALKFSAQVTYRADGNSITGHGLTPDIVLFTQTQTFAPSYAPPLPSIDPIKIETFSNFDLADKQVALKYQNAANDSSASHAEDRIEPDGQVGDTLSLNLKQRESQRRAASRSGSSPDDKLIAKVVSIAYEQSHALDAEPKN